nr:hypothetical protein GCM10020092_024030 [Actinoplanes digitatis]
MSRLGRGGSGRRLSRPAGEAAAIAAATTAVGLEPAGPSGAVVVCDYWCPDPGGEGVVSFDSPPDHTDTVAVTYDLSPAAAAEVEAAARSRLEVAGWRPGPDGELTRDGLAVLLPVAADMPAGVRVTVVVSKTVPPSAVALAAAGFVLGAILGGLLAARAARRFRRQGDAVRALAGTLTVLVTAVTFGYATTAALFLQHGGWPPDVQLAEFLLTVFPEDVDRRARGRGGGAGADRASATPGNPGSSARPRGGAH